MNTITVNVPSGSTVNIVHVPAAERYAPLFARVPSHTHAALEYVTTSDGCTCPDYVFRRNICKHIRELAEVGYDAYVEATFADFLDAYRARILFYAQNSDYCVTCDGPCRYYGCKDHRGSR